MKKNIKNSIVGLLLIIFIAFGCREDQEVAPTVSPDGYPMVSYTVDQDLSEIREGNSITYTITTDKMLDRALTFSVKILDGTADEDDITAEPAVISPYTTETQLTITFNNDMTIEDTENIKFEIGIFGIGDKYLINPDNVNPVKEMNIKAPEGLDISFGWDSEDDIDFVIYKDETGYPYSAYGDAGATLSNPEADYIALSETGTYYVCLMNWGAPNFNYTFNFGKPDATIQTLTGTFTSDNLMAYQLDYWTGWGSMYNSYRVLKIVNDGANFTITQLAPFTAADYNNTSAGEWGGTDGTYSIDYDWRFASHISTYTNGDILMIDSLNYEWMQNIWGETFANIDSVEMYIYSNGEVLIPYNYCFTTLYDSDGDSIPEEYPYHVYGYGTYDGTTLSLKYELDQDGFLVADWCLANGYSDQPWFVAEVTMAKGVYANNNFVKPNFVKPTQRANKVFDIKRKPNNIKKLNR